MTFCNQLKIALLKAEFELRTLERKKVEGSELEKAEQNYLQFNRLLALYEEEHLSSSTSSSSSSSSSTSS
jgi:hypothetical protein